MNKHVIIIAVSVLLVITIIPSFYRTFVEANNETASIVAANASVNQAFASVLAAEKAGGNVTQLLMRLNNAGELLAQAENSYRSGDLALVTSKVENARLIADQVNSDALVLRDSSISGSQNSFLLTLIFSFDGAFILIIVLLFVWRWFKRDYMKKLYASKPEVVENTA